MYPPPLRIACTPVLPFVKLCLQSSSGARACWFVPQVVATRTELLLAGPAFFDAVVVGPCLRQLNRLEPLSLFAFSPFLFTFQDFVDGRGVC
jgi:hypothetical protein